ncbi:electron transfer flavoprotein subunit alpha/FixB family protein [Bartonella sp. DGB2]|uniref:electron transfer flavoprotein subunit alpha/FixB family protein n=1 Tax=Bartonella sp. DGB2 TaxID=3388426 RepID=UPI00398F9F31
MALLLLAEHDNQSLSDQTAKALTGAIALDKTIDILVCGHECRPAVEKAASLAGVRRILHVDHPSLTHHLAENVTKVLVTLSENYTIFLSPATSNGKNIMPRLAALLDVMQISDIIEIISPDTYKRPIYAGNAIEVVQSKESKKVLTLRTSAFDAAPSGGAAEITSLDLDPDSGLSSFVSEENNKSARPDLTSARIVISGGRGLGSAEEFMALLGPLADKLNAALGASRAAVDAGYAPNDWQVGQTGKIVAPDLYIAVGISGAIQHLAGMNASKIIVAINKDEEAPLMQIADYALVADLFEAVPALVKALP